MNRGLIVILKTLGRILTYIPLGMALSKLFEVHAWLQAWALVLTVIILIFTMTWGQYDR